VCVVPDWGWVNIPMFYATWAVNAMLWRVRTWVPSANGRIGTVRRTTRLHSLMFTVFLFFPFFLRLCIHQLYQCQYICLLFIIVWCFVLRPNSPHDTLTYPGPGCSKDRRTDNVPAFGTATCIAARKGRRPEGSNRQEYVVSVMLISVHNIKVTCEWHKAIK